MSGGAIFMQSPYNEPAEVWKHIPAEIRKKLRDNQVRVFYCGDMYAVANAGCFVGLHRDATQVGPVSELYNNGINVVVPLAASYLDLPGTQSAVVYMAKMHAAVAAATFPATADGDRPVMIVDEIMV